MERNWVKNADFNYSLWVEGKEVGRMDIHFSTIASKAICSMEGMELEIKRTGFWKTNLEIKDHDGRIVLKASPEKWYANTSIIEFENKKYKLIIRNNPLAEYAVIDNDKDILAYGLDTENRKLYIRISASGDHPLIFDFLLWYLFVPIASENFGDSFSFIISPSL